MLIPFDDYPVHQTSEPLAHAGQGHPDQYDRFWFNGYTEQGYVAVALGLYPNRGVIDAAFSVVHDGVQRSVFASGRIPLDRTLTRVGPISVEIVEPMRVSRIVVDAPEHGLGADLVARGRTTTVEEARATRDEGTRRAWDYTRATQFITWEGTARSAGATLDLTGARGVKDRSWGVRPVGTPPLRAPEPATEQLFFLWSPLNFDDLCLHHMVHQDGDGISWAESGAVLPVIGPADPVHGEQGVRPLGPVRHEIDWAPGLRRARRATIHLADDPTGAGRVDLEPLFAFRMKGAGYFHPEWAHGTWRGELVVGGESATVDELDVLRPDCLHVQQVARARWGERAGLGVLEQIVLGPYAPGGFTDTLDGAPA